MATRSAQVLFILLLFASSVQGVLYSLTPPTADTTVGRHSAVLVLHTAAESQQIIRTLQHETEQQQRQGQATRGRLTDSQINDAICIISIIRSGGAVSDYDDCNTHPIALVFTKHSLLQAYQVTGGRLVKCGDGGMTIPRSFEIHGAVKAALEALGGMTSSIKDIVDYIKNHFGLFIPQSWAAALFYDCSAPLPYPTTPGPPAPMETPMDPRFRWDRATSPRPPVTTTPRRQQGSTPRYPHSKTPRGSHKKALLGRRVQSAKREDERRSGIAERGHEFDLAIASGIGNLGKELGNAVKALERMHVHRKKADDTDLQALTRREIAIVEDEYDDFDSTSADEEDYEDDNHRSAPPPSPRRNLNGKFAVTEDHDDDAMATGVASLPSPAPDTIVEEFNPFARKLQEEEYGQQAVAPPDTVPSENDDSKPAAKTSSKPSATPPTLLRTIQPTVEEEDRKPAAKSPPARPEAATRPTIPAAEEASEQKEDKAATYAHMCAVMEDLSSGFEDEPEDEALKRVEAITHPCARCGHPMPGDAGYCQNMVSDPNNPAGTQKFCGGARAFDGEVQGWEGTAAMGSMLGPGEWRCETCSGKNQATDDNCVVCTPREEVVSDEPNRVVQQANEYMGAMKAPATAPTHPFSGIQLVKQSDTAGSGFGSNAINTGGFGSFEFSAPDPGGSMFNFGSASITSGGFFFGATAAPSTSTDDNSIQDSAANQIASDGLDVDLGELHVGQTASNSDEFDMGSRIVAWVNVEVGSTILVQIDDAWCKGIVTRVTRSSVCYSFEDGSGGATRDIQKIRNI